MFSLVLLIIAIFLFYFIFGYVSAKIKLKAWEELDTLEDYLKKHTQCQTKSGITCFNCNSKSIRSWGAIDATDRRRMHICNHCDTHLYRT